MVIGHEKIAKREDIRDLILDGVDVLLAKFGYKKMTMDDVARQVGIGKGTDLPSFPVQGRACPGPYRPDRETVVTEDHGDRGDERRAGTAPSADARPPRGPSLR